MSARTGGPSRRRAKATGVDLAVTLIAAALLSLVARDGGRRPAERPRPEVVTAPAGTTVRLLRLASGELQLLAPSGIRILSARGDLALAVRGGATLEVESVGRLDSPSVRLEARRIVLAGPLRAQRVSLQADELLDLEPTADVAAAEVRLGGGVVVNTGVVSADGPAGGDVEIAAEKVMNQGALRARGFDADGGAVRVLYGSAFVESARGSIDVSGAARGGAVRVAGRRGSTLFTSGTHIARGRVGGDIALAAADVKLVVASLDASGEAGAGRITVGGKGEHAPGTPAREILVRPGSVLRADAEIDGPGGQILVAAAERTAFGGRASARGGGRGGDGGVVELSSARDLVWRGQVEMDAPAGRAGRLLIDPKNITISDTTGVLLQFELLDPTPAAGDLFGQLVYSLSTGNIVVDDPNDDFAAMDAGAVHLYRASDGALLATLVGSRAGDRVGAGVYSLGNGNYAVSSPSWDNGAVVDAGAVTWGDGTAGAAGVVSASNSLVGSTAADGVGYIRPLANGNYLVASTSWDSGAVVDAGAVTWCNGTTGRTGAVSAANSLVGATAGDQVGGVSVPVVLNPNYYLVTSSHWHNGAAADAGAVTWCSSTTGRTGVVSQDNSLVGSTASDGVGTNVVVLTNGNYVVGTPGWDNGPTRDVGAATWGNGTTGATGVVSPANSLIGSTALDQVAGGIGPLSNGNYVVLSSLWHNGAVAGAGAVTWGNGATGTTGVVSAANSLVGSTADDNVGSVYVLPNGNYVVNSPDWDNGALGQAGAVTWGNGATGTAGVVSAANSLVGTHAGDRVGSFFVTPLTNGNYVVASHDWNGVGAITWGNGASGTTGPVSAANSLVGASSADVGEPFVVALTNGNYVVSNSYWANGTATRAGAVTWGNGATGTVGTVSAANSLVGSQTDDYVGGTNRFSVVALTNGNYLVGSPNWANGGVANAGAATWGNGATGTVGVVSATNSLVGTTANDQVGWGVTAYPGGKYTVSSPTWDNGAVTDVGAVTFSDGATGATHATGAVSPANSLVGTTRNDKVGSYGAGALSDGNYVVINAAWNNGANASVGAVVGVNGATGLTGPVSAQNSLLGPTYDGGFASADAGPVAGTFWAAFSRSDSGHVFVGAINLDGLRPTYGWLASQSVTIAPRLIAATLGHGQDVTLQASNDITVAGSVAVDNRAGRGGHLTLAAGRGIAMGANVTTDDGDLTLIANDPAADGVVDQQRDPGPGGITWAAGVAVNAGAGAVEIAVRDGAGKTNRDSGTLQLGQISAATVLSRAQGGALELSSNVAATGTGSAIVLASDTSFAAGSGAVLSSPGGRYLIYAPSPTVAQTGGIPLSFAEFDKSYPAAPEATHTGSGILFASSPPDGGFDLPEVGAPDTGTPDATSPDAMADGPTIDAASPDAASPDAASPDAASPDAPPADAGADASRSSAKSGCSCSTSTSGPARRGGAALTWFAGLLVAAARRRRTITPRR
jgi:MYXO-CTERM domain-containing protein